MSDITLTSSQRQSLLSLSATSALSDRTQERLNTGKKVNSASDNATAYFQSASLSNRATDITSRKDDTDQSIQSLNAALTATSAVQTLLTQLKGVLESAKSGSVSERASDTQQFKDIGKQLAQLVKDASYQGLNLLTSSNATLKTQFSERTAATFTVNGFNLAGTVASKNALFTGAVSFSSGGALIFSAVATAAGFSALTGTGTINATAAAAVFSAAEKKLSNAISKVQAFTAALGTNVTILQTRSDFASNYSDALTSGSDKLTLADLNVEAANSSALTLRQSLGIQSLSIESTANQSILNLLR